MSACRLWPCRASGGLVLVLALFATAAPARADDLASAQEALQAKTAAALDALADWCQKKRLFGKRDEAYAALLEYDTEHEKARKKLRYTKGEDGAWVQDPRFKVGTNWKRSAVSEYEERFAAVLEAHRSALLGLCAKAKTIAELLWARGQLTAYTHRYPGDKRAGPLLRKAGLAYYRATSERGLVSEMAEMATELRSLYPEDIEIRATLGETKHEDRWMLLESARFLAGAAGLDQVVKRTMDRMGRPAEAEPTKVEAKIALPWSPGAAADDVRAMGTATVEDLRKIAMNCQAAGAVFYAALETEPIRREGFTFYVFSKKGELDTFLAGYPVVDNPSLRQKDKLDIVNVDAYGMALKANPPVGQLDGCVYQVFKLMFSDTFLDSENCRGWHAEGIVRYLSFKLLGTRYSIAVAGHYAGKGGRRDIPYSEEDWLVRARELLVDKAPVGLSLMLGKRLDAITGRDGTLSYAFSVYLIEGHEGLVTPFVLSYEKHADVDKACREILGLPVAVVEHRFRTWLEQVTPPPKEPKKPKEPKEPKK